MIIPKHIEAKPSILTWEMGLRARSVHQPGWRPWSRSLRRAEVCDMWRLSYWKFLNQPAGQIVAEKLDSQRWVVEITQLQTHGIGIGCEFRPSSSDSLDNWPASSRRWLPNLSGWSDRLIARSKRWETPDLHK